MTAERRSGQSRRLSSPQQNLGAGGRPPGMKGAPTRGGSESRRMVGEKGGLFRRGGASQGGVAVGEAAEAQDHRPVAPGVVQIAVQGRIGGGQRGKQGLGPGLIGGVFAVLEGQVEKARATGARH